MTKQEIIEAVLEERNRQDKKWGFPQYNTYSEWCAILAEEFGELSKELNDLQFTDRGNPKLFKEEAVQVIAVVFGMLESEDIAQKVSYITNNSKISLFNNRKEVVGS